MSGFPGSLFKKWNAEFGTQFAVPFCFSDNQTAFRQWSVKFDLYRQQKQRLIEQFNKALRQIEISDSAKQRLEQQKAAAENQLAEVESLLTGFNFIKSQHEIHLSLQQRIASTQHFDSYFKNIFRDWVWGDVENQVYKNILQNSKTSTGQALIIGGGAGRLAYDLASLRSSLQVLQLDINPLLSVVAEKICRGGSFDLTEIAGFTYDLNSISKKHKLGLPGESIDRNRLSFVVGDITDNPLVDNSFDCVICPWLIDIISEDFSTFSQRLNFCLKRGGELLIFGPLSFENQKPQHKHSHQELEAILIESGFEINSKDFIETEYLHSPFDPQTRIEKIIVLRATAVKAAKKPKAVAHFPSWLINKDETVKPEPSLINLQAQKNLEAQFLATVLSGKTINQMIEMLANSSAGYNKQQAEDFILSVFARLVETKEIEF